ncbi:hypothetical protein [Rhizobium paknamense]|uniref:Propionyl-coenzyme A carboxylase alpha polypeptide n=1 Tax=Rhizobium paknamense TaxID=1206817 RepID=A0ABU0IBE2_9HYPH|nr:hypothetical protein [Rhizobium paknamense]MDQ0455530.1 hypothetical protein [Rhizobium paknamense]
MVFYSSERPAPSAFGAGTGRTGLDPNGGALQTGSIVKRPCLRPHERLILRSACPPL